MEVFALPPTYTQKDLAGLVLHDETPAFYFDSGRASYGIKIVETPGQEDGAPQAWRIGVFNEDWDGEVFWLHGPIHGSVFAQIVNVYQAGFQQGTRIGRRLAQHEIQRALGL